MDALDKGYLRGREYLRRCPIEKLTFEEYKNLGKVDVKRQYKQKIKQDEYLLGWWHAGEQFASLFKLDNNDTYATEKRIKELQQRLGTIHKELDALCDWRDTDEVYQSCLENAVDHVGMALEDLAIAKEKIESEHAG